ncbi:MAG: hypothetical protein Q9165_000724 [Trypethelium subeluteriae]
MISQWRIGWVNSDDGCELVKLRRAWFRNERPSSVRLQNPELLNQVKIHVIRDVCDINATPAKTTDIENEVTETAGAICTHVHLSLNLPHEEDWERIPQRQFRLIDFRAWIHSMAPIRPASRRRTATTNSQRERVHRPIKSDDSVFASSKKDKRLIRHSALVNRIQKQNSTAKQKRRRPNKKLVATLESIADALPDVDQNAATEDTGTLHGQAKVRRKSLASRPGVQKRKEKVNKAELERFSQNLAQMIGSKATNLSAEAKSTPNSAVKPVDRWALLRGHITQNMEKIP